MPVEMLTETVGYIPGAVNIGVVRTSESGCALVDTGLNDTSAKKALKAVDSDLGLAVEFILSTHAHADHFGGNAAVVKRTGARVYAPELDEAIIRNPVLLPSLLYAGADPPKSMRGRFLLAKPSPVDVVFKELSFDVGDVEVNVIRLPGHSPGQVGFLIDSVFFTADVVLPEVALEKYRIPYLYSVADHLGSLDAALDVDAKWYVPGHGHVVESLDHLVEINRRLLLTIADRIMALVQLPRSAESIFATLIEEFDAPVSDPSAYFLLHPTVYAFLSWLEAEGRIAPRIEQGVMIWQATESVEG